jgi:C_GCAxxG_C_C family probable redox protein
MGRMRETCGAFCGVIMVAGLLYGYTEPKDFEKKSELYKRVQELAAAFREKNGSIICREMLGAAGADKNPTPERRTAEYYKKRPCPEICKNAAKVLDDYIEKNPIEK